MAILVMKLMYEGRDPLHEYSSRRTEIHMSRVIFATSERRLSIITWNIMCYLNIGPGSIVSRIRPTKLGARLLPSILKRNDAPLP
jgi:hypothetical protein